MGLSAVERLRAIIERVENLRRGFPLAAPRIALLAAAKFQPIAALAPLLEAGHREFAENRVQEAARKWPALREQYPDVTLHFIGRLQTNKAREALQLFDVIHTVDRPGLVEALAAEREREDPRCRRFFLQINTGGEPDKGGAAPKAAAALFALARARGLEVEGLMCVPPANEPAAPHFAFLREQARTLGLAALSMGMSGDYETAIRFGATHLRIGTAIFGERPSA